MAAADATPPGSDDDYLERIERHFGLRRGGRLILSPRDWQLVQEWQQAGIPLLVVMRGINRAFDRFEASGPRPGRINSLSYCDQHVLETWEEHRELAAADTGRQDDTGGDPGAARRLEQAAERCRDAAGRRDPGDEADALDAAAAALERLAGAARDGELRTREIDARATELEESVRRRLPEAFAADEEGAAPELPRFSPWAV